MPVAADQDVHVRRDRADAADAGRSDAVPDAAVFLFRDLVQQFKRQHIGVAAEARRNALPQPVKALLMRLAVKEPRLALVRVEGESRGLVQIEDHVEPVLPAQRDRSFETRISAFARGAVFVLQKLVVDRHAHMVRAPAPDHRKVAVADERVVALLRMVAMGKPAAEIDPLPIAVPDLHIHSPLMFA